MPQGISLHVGSNSVDPNHDDGWGGYLTGRESVAEDMPELARSNGFKSKIRLTSKATARDNGAFVREVTACLGVTLSISRLEPGNYPTQQAIADLA